MSYTYKLQYIKSINNFKIPSNFTNLTFGLLTELKNFGFSPSIGVNLSSDPHKTNNGTFESLINLKGPSPGGPKLISL